MPEREVRGDRFVDRLGGWTEVVLAAVSLGIVLSRMGKAPTFANAALAFLFAVEIPGAIVITRSKLPLMRFSLWLFSLRVLGGLVYISVVHGDKLARSTLGFPIIVALYCWLRVRALRAEGA